MSRSETSKENKRIVGIGSALIDVLANVDDEFLKTVSEVKGGMTLVENAFIDEVLTRLPLKPGIVPGGAACNTIVGIGRLGGSASFIGQCCDDDFGRMFEAGLLNSQVTPRLFKSKTPTGRVLSLVTPDAQRSMFTYLGASAEMAPGQITENLFKGADYAMIEGYLVFNQALMDTVLESARNAGAEIVLDLASFTVVEESGDYLMDKVDRYVDILIANEDEARAFTGFSDETKALDALAEHAETAVLKVGKRGSFIKRHRETVTVAPLTGKTAVDTTGAGDLWAAGFLFGLMTGLPLEKCGQLASACGYEVCLVPGANIPDDGWARVKKFL